MMQKKKAKLKSQMLCCTRERARAQLQGQRNKETKKQRKQRQHLTGIEPQTSRNTVHPPYPPN